MTLFTIEHVVKEQIPELNCFKNEVLETDSDIRLRKISIERATQLSKNFYLKALIVFKTQEGLKEVRTTIWAATDKNIVLKGGVTLPVCCIKSVSIS
jgi:hypothetical protein